MAIKKCTCEHQFQDKKYGKQNRVHNKLIVSSKGAVQKYRCTVCGRER